MSVTASKLRENIYRILDEAVETGVPIEVIRKGVVLRIVPQKKPSKPSRLSKLEHLPKRVAYNGNPDDPIKSTWLESGGYEEWLEEWKDLK